MVCNGVEYPIVDPVSTCILFSPDGLWANISTGLANIGPDSDWLEIARRENRIIITADLDFPRILALSISNGPGVILFRGGNDSEAEMRELPGRVLTGVQTDILEKSICVVDKNRIRITHLPLARSSLRRVTLDGQRPG
jgi:predicted nuclease of predicted toxin-antitoxin system